MMSFAQKVLEYKNTFGSLAEVVDQTDLFFDDNYFQGAKINNKFNPPFIPGQIYSFFYKTPSSVSEQRKFINRNPIVLCVHSFQDKNMGLVLRGVDLITVPPDIRVTILGRIYDRFFSELELGNSPLPITDENLKSLLIGTGFQKSIFGFKTTYFGDIYRIEPKDWCKIPYLGKSFVEGLNLRGIYTEYKSKLI